MYRFINYIFIYIHIYYLHRTIIIRNVVHIATVGWVYWPRKKMTWISVTSLGCAVVTAARVVSAASLRFSMCGSSWACVPHAAIRAETGARRLATSRSISLSVYAPHDGTVGTSNSALLHAMRRYATASPLLRGRRMMNNRKRRREASEGDWTCQCGEVNYKSKRECFKCGSPAPPLPPGVRRPSLPGEDPHDWACPCGSMNFRGSVVCYKCQQPKPEPPPLPGKEVLLWTCPKCKSINRNTRKYCFKCSVPSPLLNYKSIA